MVKALAVPGVIFIVAEALPKIVNEGFGAVAVTAGGLAGIGYLLHLMRRVRKNWRSLFDRVQGGLDIIESSPERFEKLEKRLDRHHTTLEKHAKALDVLADADEHRIKDAIAGDQRSPVDRRAA